MNILAFNMFIAPVLEFICQLCPINEVVHQAFHSALTELASGPGNWINQNDTMTLKLFGFPASFKNILVTHRFAKLRVIKEIMPDVNELHARIVDAQRNCFRRPFGQWHSSWFVSVLFETNTK